MPVMRPIDALDVRHLMSMILYIHENGSCRKIDVYTYIGRGANMPRKFRHLEDSGIVRTEACPEGEFLSLTEEWDGIARRLLEIEGIIGGDRTPSFFL